MKKTLSRYLIFLFVFFFKVSFEDELPIKETQKTKIYSEKTYNILTFDGGGVRGAYTAQILAMLEEKLKFIQNVDFFVGTSTGSIIACALSYGITPSEIVSFYQNKSGEIFKERITKKGLSGIKDCFLDLFKRNARYKTQNLKNALCDVFEEDLLLSDLSKKVLCVSFNLYDSHINNWAPTLIDNFRDQNISVIDAILKSSAAPTYFPSYQGHIDGGLIANNPSMMGLARALDEKGANQDLSNIRLLSLGTGIKTSYIDKDVDWGTQDWMFHPSLDFKSPLTPMLDIILDGTVSVPHFQCLKILKGQYFRINPFLSIDVPLDDWTKVDDLIEEAKKLEGTDEWNEMVFWIKKNFL